MKNITKLLLVMIVLSCCGPSSQNDCEECGNEYLCDKKFIYLKEVGFDERDDSRLVLVRDLEDSLEGIVPVVIRYDSDKHEYNYNSFAYKYGDTMFYQSVYKLRFFKSTHWKPRLDTIHVHHYHTVRDTVIYNNHHYHNTHTIREVQKEGQK